MSVCPLACTPPKSFTGRGRVSASELETVLTGLSVDEVFACLRTAVN